MRNFLAKPALRETFWWCLPALLVGLALRIAVTWALPYAIYHDDTGDALTTAQSMLADHRFEMHGKKTFLVPIFYAAMALVRVPLLIGVPLVQHLVGLVLVFMVGALCRLWLVRWRWFIIPVTLIVAVNPPILWFEHVMMAETAALSTVVWVALAGTLYALRQSVGRLGFLAASLFFAAGARPEGKLLFGFGLFLVVLLHFRAWRKGVLPFATLAVLGIATHFITRTGQAGLLLYTSVARITPSSLTVAPGFEPYIAAIRADLKKRWEERLAFPKVEDRRQIAAAVGQYGMDHAGKNDKLGHEETDALCLRLAKETCLRNLAYLPTYAVQKFRHVSRDAPAGALDGAWLYKRQIIAFSENYKLKGPLIKRVTGQNIRNEAEYTRFVLDHYTVVPWFNSFNQAWASAVASIRPPDTYRLGPPRAVIIRQIPVLYLLATVGLVLLPFRHGRPQPLHLAWSLTLVGFFLAIMLTANVRPRFRFVFEPFWYLYSIALLDCLLYWILPKKTREVQNAEVENQHRPASPTSEPLLHHS